MKKRRMLVLVGLTMILMTGCCISHDWKDATCTKPKTCSKCGKTEGEALGHNVKKYEVTKEPTCVDEGIEEGKCSFCGEIQSKRIPATGKHAVEEYNVTKEATCTEKGEQEGTCTVCKALVKESIDMIPHVDDGNMVITKAATETTAGTKATHCTACGKEMQTETYELTVEEKNALKFVRQDMPYMHYSKKGLTDEMQRKGYADSTIQLVLETMNYDWNEQAAEYAKQMTSSSGMAKAELIDWMTTYEGFTNEEAEYACSQIGY